MPSPKSGLHFGPSLYLKLVFDIPEALMFLIETRGSDVPQDTPVLQTIIADTNQLDILLEKYNQ